MFAKIFSQIFDSSIAEDYLARHVFMDLLVLADRDGVVDMTVSAISRRTNVPEEIVASAINKLLQPDPESRSKIEEGRRIIPIDSHRDWGWEIVNYDHYRNIIDDESRRAYFRDKKRESRQKSKESNSVKPVLDSPQMSTQAEVVSEGLNTLFEELWSSWPNHNGGKADALKKFNSSTKGFDKATVIDRAKRQVDIWKLEGKPKQFIPHLQTWLNQKRFDIEPESSTAPIARAIFVSGSEQMKRRMEEIQ